MIKIVKKYIYLLKCSITHTLSKLLKLSILKSLILKILDLDFKNDFNFLNFKVFYLMILDLFNYFF